MLGAGCRLTATTSAKRCTGAVRDWAASTMRTMSATAAGQATDGEQRLHIYPHSWIASCRQRKRQQLQRWMLQLTRTSVPAAVDGLHADLAVVVDGAGGDLVPCTHNERGRQGMASTKARPASETAKHAFHEGSGAVG